MSMSLRLTLLGIEEHLIARLVGKVVIDDSDAATGDFRC